MRLGLERLEEVRMPGGRIGLLTHYAAVDGRLREAVEVVSSLPGVELAAVFGPQHGYYGQTQDNMIEWESTRSRLPGVPLYSLYGEVREPTPGMLEGLDALVVDLQDVGARYYTYVYAMALTMRAAARAGLPVVVLDRPNPLGMRVVEGRTLDPAYSSYVGMYPVPVRHALTIAELALLFAGLDGLEAPTVAPLEGWRGTGIEDAAWVMPSPNMPSTDTAMVYPGMCLLEATNISEGRGTTRPFEIFGAPWIDGFELAGRLEHTGWLSGAVLRPHEFIPTFGKHVGRLCRGAQLHVTDPALFRPYRAGLAILMELWTWSETGWKPPPYEYERERMPIDILTGGTEVREAVETHDTGSIDRLAAADIEEWTARVSPYLLYERDMTG